MCQFHTAPSSSIDGESGHLSVPSCLNLEPSHGLFKPLNPTLPKGFREPSLPSGSSVLVFVNLKQVCTLNLLFVVKNHWFAWRVNQWPLKGEYLLMQATLWSWSRTLEGHMDVTKRHSSALILVFHVALRIFYNEGHHHVCRAWPKSPEPCQEKSTQTMIACH